MAAPSHGASHSALGYLYQSQWPLLQLLQRSGGQPDMSLTLELHDDVSWEQDGAPIELLQIKHHVDHQRGLGDKDVDLWKTLAVWMDANAPANPLGPLLTLVTTRVVTQGAASALRPESRSAGQARELLDAAAKDSNNQVTVDARQKYLALEEAERDIFVGRIYVLDGAPQAGAELEKAVEEALHFALPLSHEKSFLEQLWGWWHRQAVEILRRERDTVNGMDIRLKVQEIADGYKPDNLPTLVERDDVDIDVEKTYGDQVFVTQLRWVLHSAQMLQKAMMDYYRSYVQRAQWVDRDLIGISELEKFEDNLVDEWERAFDAMNLQLGDEADDDAMQKAGHALFQEISNQTAVKVRERYTEPFFMRGQLHEFADKGRVGWHPDFQGRLKELLGQ